MSINSPVGGPLVSASGGSTTVAISGVPQVGQTVSAPPGAASYQWTRSGSAISGATSRQYTCVTADQTAGANALACIMTTAAVTVAAAPVLATLTLAATAFTGGSPFSVAINGKTAGSSIAATSSDGTALTVSGSTLSGTFTAGGSPNNTLVETLAGATGSPKTTVIGVTVTAATGANDLLLVLFGQSNQAGQGTQGFTASSTLTALANNPNIRIFNGNTGSTGTPMAWQSYQVQVNSDPGQGTTLQFWGAEGTFLAYYAAKFPNAKIDVIKMGPGGSQLFDGSDIPSRLPGAVVATTQWWPLLLSTIAAAKAAGLAVRAGYKTIFDDRGGETDSQTQAKANVYQANLGTQYARAVSDIGAQGIIVHQLFGSGSNFTALAANYPYAETVREAQAAAAAAFTTVPTVLVDDSFAWIGNGSGIHYPPSAIDGASGTGARLYSVFAAPAIQTAATLSSTSPQVSVPLTYTPAAYDYVPQDIWTAQFQSSPDGTTWTNLGAAIALTGAAVSYTPVAGDVGNRLRVVEVAAGFGPVLTTNSAATSAVIGTAYDSDATALFAAMTTQPSGADKTTISNWIAARKTDGTWAKLLRFEFFHLQDAQSSSLEWKTKAQLVVANGTTAPTFTPKAGWALDGVSQYLDTGLVHSAFGTLNSGGFGLDIVSGSSTTDACGVSAGGQRLSLEKAVSGAILAGIMGTSITALGSGNSPPARATHHYLLRTVSGSFDYYNTGAKQVTVTSASAGLQAANLWLGRNGTGYTNDNFLCAYFTDGTWTASDASNFDTALQSLKSGLGA